MIVALKDGKKLIPLKSGTTLLFGVRGDKHNLYLCNTGECPTETNDTVILAPEEIDEVIVTLAEIKREILVKSGTYSERLRQVV
jgi:hypothetical protein